MTQTDDRSCRHPSGAMVPAIDGNRCEGKAAPRAGADGPAEGICSRLKRALTPHAAARQASARCVEACPEGAITLVRS